MAMILLGLACVPAATSPKWLKPVDAWVDRVIGPIAKVLRKVLITAVIIVIVLAVIAILYSIVHK